MKKKSETSTAKRFSALMVFFEHTFIVAIILGCLGFFWTSYFAFREKILLTYDNLAKDIESYIFLDENAYVFCSYVVKNKGIQYGCLKDVEMFKVRGSMIGQFEKINYDIRSLGKFLSYDIYKAVHQFTYYNNLILISDKGICESNLLVDSENMDRWRTALLLKITTERAHQKSLHYSLPEYFLHMLTDVEDERYSSPEDNLQNIPIYDAIQKNQNNKI